MSDALNPAIVSSTQWFERTLDDSANKRLSVAEGFLAIDGVLDLRFGMDDGTPRTLEEVGKHFGVTRERIRQIESKALKKLKKAAPSLAGM